MGMEATDILWGLITIGSGVFISVYGTMLFKFALAAMGFSVGFVGGWWLLEDQDTAARFLIAMVVGAVLAIVFFSLVKFGVYIAGAVLGLVLAVVVSGFIEILGASTPSFVMLILAIGGVAGGGLFGGRLGNIIILLATAAAGSYMIVGGLQTWFESVFDHDGVTAAETLGTGVAMALFVVLFAMSVLSQRNAQQLRHRVLR